MKGNKAELMEDKILNEIDIPSPLDIMSRMNEEIGDKNKGLELLAENQVEEWIKAAGLEEPILRYHTRGIIFKLKELFGLIEKTGEKYGPFSRRIPIFELHCPYGGKFNFTVARGISDKAEISLSFLGSGFGSGKSRMFQFKQGLSSEGNCYRIEKEIEFNIEKYILKGIRGERIGDLYRTNVLKMSDFNIPQVIKNCDDCGKDIHDLNKELYNIQKQDVTGVDPSDRMQISLRYENGFKDALELGFKIPILDRVLKVKIKKNMEILNTLEWSMDLKGGKRYYCYYQKVESNSMVPYYWTPKL